MAAAAPPPPSFHIAIPSRGRAKGLYLQTYRKLVWRHELEAVTTVFVQTQEDLEAYSAMLPRLKVVLVEGTGLAAAQEAIRTHYPVGSRVVIAHDDVTRIMRFRDRHSRRFEDVHRLFHAAFEVMQAYGLTLGGLAPTDNPLNEDSQEVKVTLGLRFIYDPVHFEIICEERVPLVTTLKHDVERSVWHYRWRGGLLRLAAYAVGTRHSSHAPNHAELEARDMRALKDAYAEEIACFRTRKGGYHSVILKPLPNRSGHEDAAAQTLFTALMGDFDVAPRLELPGGRLLDLLQRRKWRVNDQRTNVVPAERRIVVRSRHGKQALRADAPVFSEGLREGDVFETCMAVLPAGLSFDFVTINRNLRCHPHRDAGNAGLSMVLFLGRFEGGALVFETGERFTETGVLRVFDGRTLHWNEAITGGVKYSVVFYGRESQRLRPHSVPPPGAGGGAGEELRPYDGTPVPF